MQLSDRLFQKKLLKERKILEKVQRTANKKEREYLFVEKLLQRVKVKILAFFCKQSYNNYEVERSGEKSRETSERWRIVLSFGRQAI